MTPKRIADISEPIEQLYSDLTDELLINIAKHLSKSTATWSALHEIETLEEMGQLTQENIEIINTYVAKMPQEIKNAMNESRLEALGEIEKKLADAAANGYLTTPVSDSTVDIVQAFSAQAADQLNLVNQTMLNTSLEQYRSGVYEFRQEMNNAAIKTIETEQQLQQAQKEINIAAGKVVAGTETRTKALRKCIATLNNTGIVGYYDRSGRAWSAEAYVNMDMRTTVHNTYIQTVKERQNDYGSDVFQVSSHAGARPLCYPYQGKLYSWGATGGNIKLGDGKTYRYEPISVTSYGEAAGLFGINCGHVPYPMIPNVSELAQEKIQPKEENDREYQESQEQRALERQIRHAKRGVEMLGDLATDADRQKVAAAQAKMREFIKETGRTRRYDREQIVTKRNETPTAARPTVKTPIAPTEPLKPINNKTIDKIQLGEKLTESLGKDAEEYKGVIEKAPDRIKSLYNKLSDKLQIVEKGRSGYYQPSLKKIMWRDSPDKDSKWSTLAHEYGHFADDLSSNSVYTSNEINAINDIIGLSVRPLKNTISSSDKFLAALRADKELNKGYAKNAEFRKPIHDELMKERNLTSGVQDCFDGWFSTQKSTNPDYRLPWGHGDRYYNKFYNTWINGYWDNTDEVKQVFNDLGLKAKTKADVKRLVRDYMTASELFANITSSMTCNDGSLKYFEKYTPNSLQAYIELTEDLMNVED